MYKLTKGIKKKVKGKKKPTEEELEQEELRQYRLEKQREREQKEQEQREQAQTEESGEDQEETEAADPNAESSQRQEKSAPESDEWAKFRALTSGVDSVLSTTKESLQTIKETSYFIRKKAAKDPEEGKRDEKPAVAVASKPKWVDVDAGEEEEEAEEPAAEPVTAPVEEPPRSPTPEKVDLELVLSEVEKLERAQYFEEDVFNTEYVDAVTSGDINFAVIPDSPTEEGDDPFDTSVVDQVLRETPEQQKRNKLKAIKLGKAVQLLSGAQEDAEKPEEAEGPAEAPSAPGPHSQLPADEDFDPFDTSAADQFGHTELRVLESELIGELSPVTLDPFDTSIAERYGTTELRVLEREFAAADASPTSVLKRSVSDPDFDPRGDEKVARPETPQLGVNLLDSQLGGGHLVPVLAASAVSETADEAELADPFDTSIADSLLPGQAELQVLERELLQS
ncbi:protein stoned-A-like [Pollicipes pollicipes]|uniref:protein stoned-A-like n=1 Tax=Pollicipes pollicipes TaxID=41117 RepID=UPI001885965E|nr:protein stoned-A-like [Pollicipes pollicipes]